MKRFIESMLLFICMMTIFTIGAVAIEVDYALIAEDTEIMARIIDKTLEEKFPNEYRASSLFRESFGCQGTYLKGYGVIFTANVGFMVAKQASLKDEKANPDDLWQRTKYEITGVSFANNQIYKDPFIVGEKPVYNSEKVEKLKEELLKAIGLYAINIRQLDAQDNNITIIVKGLAIPSLAVPVSVGFAADIGKSTDPFISTSSDKSRGTSATTVEAIPATPPSASVPEEPVTIKADNKSQKSAAITAPAAPVAPSEVSSFSINSSKGVVEPAWGASSQYGASAPYYTYTYALPSAMNTGKNTTLIIKVKRAAILEYKESRIDFSEFAKYAEITQY